MYIDDDHSNLVGFQAAFPDLDIHIYQYSGPALKDILVINPKIIIADFKMAKMDGIEVLSESIKVDPFPIRILTTGAELDKQTWISIMSFAQATNFIEKPITDFDKVEKILELGIKQYEERRTRGAIDKTTSIAMKSILENNLLLQAQVEKHEGRIRELETELRKGLSREEWNKKLDEMKARKSSTSEEKKKAG